MTDTDTPLPGWIRAIGVATVVAMLPLVILGGQTTTRMAGMADPVWPTEPWYLVVNGHVFLEEPQPGFLLEHTHRAAGWITGGLASLFVLCLWLTDQGVRKIAGLGFTIMLLVAYGAFHGSMMRIKNDPQAFGSSQTVLGAISIVWALGLISVGIYGVIEKSHGGMARLLASVGLVGVMIQGLLGGFRVLLNVWFGPDLAIVHGCFAHVVVCTFIATLVLANRPKCILTPEERSAIGNWALASVAFVFLQLVWGALTRHTGTAFAQRLHLITAFLATAVILAIVAIILTRLRYQFPMHAAALLVIVFLQVTLGVEAYLGKFAAVGPFAHLPPSQRPISDSQAITRTLHVLMGLTLLATLVSLTVRVFRRNPQFVELPMNTIDSIQADTLNPVAV